MFLMGNFIQICDAILHSCLPNFEHLFFLKILNARYLRIKNSNLFLALFFPFPKVYII